MTRLQAKWAFLVVVWLGAFGFYCWCVWYFISSLVEILREVLV